MIDEFVAKSNVVYVFYKACLDGEIDIETFKKCFDIIKRARLPKNVKVSISWSDYYEAISE